MFCKFIQSDFKCKHHNAIALEGKKGIGKCVFVTNCKHKHCLRLFTHPFLLIHTWFQKISTWQMLKINEDPQDNK